MAGLSWAWNIFYRPQAQASDKPIPIRDAQGQVTRIRVGGNVQSAQVISSPKPRLSGRGETGRHSGQGSAECHHQQRWNRAGCASSQWRSNIVGSCRGGRPPVGLQADATQRATGGSRDGCGRELHARSLTVLDHHQRDVVGLRSVLRERSQVVEYRVVHLLTGGVRI